MSYPDPPMAYIISRTDAVFLGTVVKVSSQTKKLEGAKYRINTVSFRVDETLKTSTKLSTTSTYYKKLTNLTSCDVEPPDPKVGQKWVVFQGYDEGGNVQLYVRHAAHLSWHYKYGDSHSQEQLEEIRAALSAPRNRFYGQLDVAMVGVPPSDDYRISVELRGPNGEEILQTVRPVKGHFTFEDVDPGKYILRINSAKNLELFVSEKFPMKTNSDGSYFAEFPINIARDRPEFMNITFGWE